MDFLPRTLGTRPRLACEVRAEGVVAARAEDAFAVLSAVARVPLADEIVLPRPQGEDDPASPGVGGDAAGRAAVVAALRKALEAVSLRSREVTLVVPDAAVRAKPAEALPVVRFRLKKLLPFDADDAAISYQVMATSKGSLQVLAVAMPRKLLADYESVVREAGFEPGAILPSTLAALAGLPEEDAPLLVVNAGRRGVTTAIVKAGVVLLHRTVDLGADLRADAAAAQLAELAQLTPPAEPEQWQRQEPASFNDRNDASAAIEASALAQEIVLEVAHEIAQERSFIETIDEVAQAVSVAAAYFEDTLQAPPALIHAAGTLGAATLAALLDGAHVGPLAVQEILHTRMLGAGAASAGSPGGVPLGWLAGVRGALAN
jgi:type IV pilus assembly protein PilM